MKRAWTIRACVARVLIWLVLAHAAPNALVAVVLSAGHTRWAGCELAWRDAPSPFGGRSYHTVSRVPSRYSPCRHGSSPRRRLDCRMPCTAWTPEGVGLRQGEETREEQQQRACLFEGWGLTQWLRDTCNGCVIQALPQTYRCWLLQLPSFHVPGLPQLNNRQSSLPP